MKLGQSGKLYVQTTVPGIDGMITSTWHSLELAKQVKFRLWDSKFPYRREQRGIDQVTTDNDYRYLWFRINVEPARIDDNIFIFIYASAICKIRNN